MKLIVLFVFTFLVINFVEGQKYKTADIRANADSILKSYIGDTVFSNYCLYDNNTYYEYKNIFGNSKFKTLSKSKKTKGNFVGVDMRWFLLIPFPQCPEYDSIKGMTSFELGSQLQPKGKPYFDFIPDFYWSKDSCQLINEANALNIARQQNLKQGISSLVASLKYESQTKTFSWEVEQTLWTKKDMYDNNYGEIENVSINAITGEVTSHEILSFSAIY